MDNNKIKNMAIISFLILNVILFIITNITMKSYQLPQSDIENITKLLNSNNIVVDAIIPKDYSAINQIELLPYKNSNQKLVEIFFNDSSTRFTDEFGKRIFKDEFETKILTIEKSGFFFENNEIKVDVIENFNLDKADKLCQEMLNKFNVQDFKLKFDRSYEREDALVLEYRSIYSSKNVFSSFARFKVTQSGIKEVKANFYKFQSFTENPRNIYSANEALQSFLHDWKRLYGESWEEITIDKIDVVFKVDEEIVDTNKAVLASPYYRISIKGRQEPVFVNAYEGEVR